MARVAFHHVSKRFDETPALTDFDLTIDDGEFVVLVGPSGCGKSTALRLLAGLEAVSEGEIRIDDRVVNQVSPQQRNIAMVFQNYALYPHMDVRANLAFPLRMAGMSAQAIDNKVREIAALLDLSALLMRKPKQLSGGQRQRVAMGRALVRDPSVFLLDEPLSNLDAQLRAQIRADMGTLQRRLNKTTLYVTHDQVEAMTLGDRVAVMHGGQLQQVATPTQLYQQPANVFVARFIGSPGMNILPSRLVRQGENQLAVELGRHVIPLPPQHPQTGPNLSRYLDQAIQIGIRPEAMSAMPLTTGVEINASIQSVEYLGHESLVYVRLPATPDRETEHKLIARVAGQYTMTERTPSRLYLDPMDLYLFNGEGQVI